MTPFIVGLALGMPVGILVWEFAQVWWRSRQSRHAARDNARWHRLSDFING